MQTAHESRRKAPIIGDAALLGSALVLVVALMAVLVHVLNEQVRRGETWREQFRQAATQQSLGPDGLAATASSCRSEPGLRPFPHPQSAIDC